MYMSLPGAKSYNHIHAVCTSACLWNARSLGNKLKPFQAFVYSSQLQIFAVTETWLHSSIMDGEIIASGFTLLS